MRDSKIVELFSDASMPKITLQRVELATCGFHFALRNANVAIGRFYPSNVGLYVAGEGWAADGLGLGGI